MEIAKVDKKGRVAIPKKLREHTGIEEGSHVRIKPGEGEILVIEPSGSIAEKLYGAFKIEKWPENLDEFIAEAIKRWWLSQSM